MAVQAGGFLFDDGDLQRGELMSRQRLCAILLACAASTLSACGGGGGRIEVASIPPPPTPPPPPPAASDPLLAPPKGVTATTQLASIGAFQDVKWNADLAAYEVVIDGASGKIVAGPMAHNIVGADGSARYTVSTIAQPTFEYTRIGEVETLPDYSNPRAFAFGVPTPAGSVPTTGNATYDAQVTGQAGSWPVYGTAQFQFDFGAGTLSGYMDPHTNGPMESPPLPRYTFSQTVFSPGSTTFSGSFDFSGPTPSSFNGQFTGPNAQELMAQFTAPFRDWDAQENPTVWGVMNGVMVGRRH